MTTALVVRVSAAEVELAADRLWSFGVLAVEERVIADDPEHAVELWSSVGENQEDIERAIAELSAMWPTRCEYVDDSITESWRQFAVPTTVDDELTLVPAWWDGPLPTAAVSVRIEPGTSFGLGDHPTTVLTARAMRHVLQPGMTVADIGCGSGVLSIVAARFGAAHVEAIDISEAAIRATDHNAAANGVADTVAASLTPCADLVGPFDLVVANVLAPALVAMSDDLVRITADRGTLIISGVLVDRHQHVADALAPLVVTRTDTHDGWAAVTLSRHT